MTALARDKSNPEPKSWNANSRHSQLGNTRMRREKSMKNIIDGTLLQLHVSPGTAVGWAYLYAGPWALAQGTSMPAVLLADALALADSRLKCVLFRLWHFFWRRSAIKTWRMEIIGNKHLEWVLLSPSPAYEGVASRKFRNGTSRVPLKPVVN